MAWESVHPSRLLFSRAQGGDDRPAELGEIGRRAGGDQVAVHHDGAVLPHEAGVHEVVLDGADAGPAPPPHDPRRDRDPARVADERHRLPRLEDLPSELEHPARAAQDVGRVPAGNHQAVEAWRLDVLHADVGRDRVAALPLVGPLAQARDDGADALLLQPDLGIPELEVLVERGREEEHRGPLQTGHGRSGGWCSHILPYFRSTASRRSTGSAYTRLPSAPVIVSAASRALRMASSVAPTVSSNSGLIRSLGSMVSRTVPVSADAPGFAVEKETKRSPEESSPSPPMRPTPRAARRASRSSWCGMSGASVAMTMMIDPLPLSSEAAPGAVAPDRAHGGRRSAPPARVLQGSRSAISRPTGAPRTLRRLRWP